MGRLGDGVPFLPKGDVCAGAFDSFRVSLSPARAIQISSKKTAFSAFSSDRIDPFHPISTKSGDLCVSYHAEDVPFDLEDCDSHHWQPAQ